MTGPVRYPEPPTPAFLFDLDGTLIDSVYQHVIAWRAALTAIGIDLSVWRIHRRVGKGGRPVGAGAAAGDRADAVAGRHRAAAAGARGRIPQAARLGDRAARRARAP